MILIIDNYDSFTQNLAQYVGEIGFSPIVIRNNHITIQEIRKLKPTHIILSPGPGHPRESKISLKIIKYCSTTIPILGVCLGHQCIGHVYGCNITQLKIPMHGKVSKIIHHNTDIFNNLSNPFDATRYHSLIINNQNIPKDIEVTAWTTEGLIMACRHKKYPMLRGIQFHPESVWTTEGKKLIENFVYTQNIL